MIEIYSSNLLIIENGQRTTLGVEELCRDLVACAQAVGVNEPWLAEHLVLAVEEFVAARAGQEPVTRTEIDQLLARLLVHSGYSDVAEEFARRRRLLPIAVAEPGTREPEPWNSERIATLLRRHFPLANGNLAQACSRVAGKLALLGFAQVTDRLVIEVAGLVLRAGDAAGERGSLASNPWLVSPDDCRGIVLGIESDVRRQEVYGLRPVSRLLPAVHVTLHLNRLGQSFDGPTTEIVLWPAVRKLSTGARTALTALQARVIPCQAPDGQLPPRLTIGGAVALVDNLCGPMSRAKARRMACDIVESVRQDAVAGLPFPVIVQVVPR